MLLADGPGGAVQGLARRLRVAELLGLPQSRHGRLSRGEARRRCSALRTGRHRDRRGRLHLARQGSWSGGLLEVILVGPSPVGNMCGFLVSFHQESFGHLGGDGRKGTWGRWLMSPVSRLILKKELVGLYLPGIDPSVAEMFSSPKHSSTLFMPE